MYILGAGGCTFWGGLGVRFEVHFGGPWGGWVRASGTFWVQILSCEFFGSDLSVHDARTPGVGACSKPEPSPRYPEPSPRYVVVWMVAMELCGETASDVSRLHLGRSMRVLRDFTGQGVPVWPARVGIPRELF